MRGLRHTPYIWLTLGGISERPSENRFYRFSDGLYAVLYTGNLMAVRLHTGGSFGVGGQAEGFAQHDFIKGKRLFRALDGLRLRGFVQRQRVQKLDESAPVFATAVGVRGEVARAVF